MLDVGGRADRFRRCAQRHSLALAQHPREQVSRADARVGQPRGRSRGGGLRRAGTRRPCHLEPRRTNDSRRDRERQRRRLDRQGSRASGRRRSPALARLIRPWATGACPRVHRTHHRRRLLRGPARSARRRLGEEHHMIPGDAAPSLPSASESPQLRRDLLSPQSRRVEHAVDPALEPGSDLLPPLGCHHEVRAIRELDVVRLRR
jgi:hypothetical protein